MPPAHKRNIDDSRSETSSTVPNHKDGKNGLVPTGTAGHSKANRAGNGSTAKAPVNVAAVAATVPAITIDKDPKLPRVCYKCPLNSTHPTNNRNSQQADWVSTPNSVLRTYRIAYRLQAPSTFCHAHADIIHKSSATALRSPSAVLARRRLREEKHRRRKLDHLQLVNDTSTTTSNKPGKSKNKSRRADKDKDKDGSKTSTLETSSTVGSTVAQSIEPPDATQSTTQSQPHPPSSPSSTSTTTYLGPPEPSSQLAVSVRKHFNAQQVSEADTIARFTYVLQQVGRPVWTEGCEGDGAGSWMGSHGREVRKADGPGGEVGFRLRFRP